MSRVAQAKTVEGSCYMFSGAEKYGLSCDGCKYQSYCRDRMKDG